MQATDGIVQILLKLLYHRNKSSVYANFSKYWQIIKMYYFLNYFLSEF